MHSSRLFLITLGALTLGTSLAPGDTPPAEVPPPAPLGGR